MSKPTRHVVEREHDVVVRRRRVSERESSASTPVGQLMHLQRSVGNRATSTLLGTRQAVGVHREFDDDAPLLANNEDANERWHKNFGKQLVVAYRYMDAVDEQMKKGKNREALKAAAIGLGQTGLQIASLLSPIPGMTDGGGLDGGLVPNTGAESIAQESAMTATDTGLGLAESEMPAPASATTGGRLKAMAPKTKGEAAKAAAGFIPFVTAAQTLLKSAQTAAKSQDDWNRLRSELVAASREVMSNIDGGLEEANQQYGDTTVTTANKTLMFRHKSRTFAEVRERYDRSAVQLGETIAAWVEKHGEHERLLGPSSSSDAHT